MREIYAESSFLRLCVIRPGVLRYWERIYRRESYLVFLRKKASPDKPFYLIEVEPGGVIRQKRSFDDLQYADLDKAMPFLLEWQHFILDNLSEKDKVLSIKSRVQRERDMEDLRKNKITVKSGYLSGQLLADVLAADLLDINFEGEDESLTKEKVV